MRLNITVVQESKVMICRTANIDWIKLSKLEIPY
jgi:hypothetical protein